MRGVKTRTGSRWKKFGSFFVLVFLLAALLHSVNNVYKKKKSADEVLARMQDEMKSLTERQNFLRESLERLSTPEGLKFEIRKKLNVAEAGESVAIIVEEEQSSTTPVLSISPWRKFKNFWSSLFK